MTDRLDTEGKPGNKPGAQNDDTTQVTGTIDSRHLSSVVEQRFRKASLPSAESNTSDPAPVNAGFAARGCEMSADEALTEVGWGGAVLMQRLQLETTSKWLEAFAIENGLDEAAQEELEEKLDELLHATVSYQDVAAGAVAHDLTLAVAYLRERAKRVR